MTKYQELRDAFIGYKDAKDLYFRENETLALLIVEGLRSYLEMPTHFTSIIDGKTEVKTYLPLYGYDDADQIEDARFMQEALEHFSDGSFKFAFGVILERGEGSFPKQNLIHHVVCERNGGSVTIKIAGEKYECKFDGKSCEGIEKVHAGIFAKLLKWLRHRPGDGQTASKFGFQLRQAD